MNVYEKLASARVQLQNKKLEKSGLNKFAGFKYFELKDFLPSVNEIFNNLKLISVFNITNESATLEVINAEKLDEKIIFNTPTAEVNIKGAADIQSLGGKHTYLKRYLYINALEIAENDMIDALPDDKKDLTKKAKQEAVKSQESAKPELITQDQINVIMKLYTAERIEKMLNFYSIKTIKEMKYDDALTVISKAEKEKHNA